MPNLARVAALATAGALFAVACEPVLPRIPTTEPAAPGPGATPPPTGPASNGRFSIVLEPWAEVPGRPLAIAAPDDGTGRLFVASQEGTIWSVDQDGAVSQEPMIDLRERIRSGGERGLLGLALHPAFPDDPRAFANYTNVDGHTVIASLALDPGNPDRFDPGSHRELLRVDQPYANHNGGGVVFGPDGYLYLALGDGGSGGDPHDHGQRLDTLLGKILRIDVDAGDAYAIPPGNPFAGAAGEDEIWHFGLRNPWRLSFDRDTGDLWIGDVGQGAWEEIDVARDGEAGLNFGWNRMEGAHCFRGETCSPEGLTLPVTEYGHDLGCTVIGGYVYRGVALPVLEGAYLFADYCSGRIFSIDSATASLTVATEVGRVDGNISAFGEGADGELFITMLQGTVSRVTATERSGS